MSEILIRKETPADFRVCEELTREAFFNRYVPGCDEHYLLHIMRDCSAFLPELSLVAAMNGGIIGHIAYMRAKVELDGGGQLRVLSFGPVSVSPPRQSQGVGGALIKRSLEMACDMGESAVIIYGDPRYYSRFGFRCAEKYDIKTGDGKYAAALLALELKKGALSGSAGRFCEDQAFDMDQAKVAEFDKGFAPKEKRSDLPSQREFAVLSVLRY